MGNGMTSNIEEIEGYCKGRLRQEVNICRDHRSSFPRRRETHSRSHRQCMLMPVECHREYNRVELVCI